MRTPKLTFAGLGLAVGLVLATATPSQAVPTGNTTSTTVFRIQSGDVEYTAAAVGDIGLSAQSAGATIEFSVATWNTASISYQGGQTTAFIWLDIDAPNNAFDRRIETSGSIVIFNNTAESGVGRYYFVGQGTITFSPLRPTNDFEVRFLEPVTALDPGLDNTFIVPGDAVITLGLTIRHNSASGGTPYDPDFGLVHIDVESSGPLPKLPSLFTDEQKAKFQSDANDLKTIGLVVSGLGGTVDSNPAASFSNTAASELASAISPQVGTANSTLQTALSLTDGLISAPTNPISLVFALTGTFNQGTVGILEYLANLDPPDGSYLDVFAAPDWSFGDIDGASAAGNALVRDSYALFQESLNLLAAAERFQGADLAGNTDAKAMQEAAFNAALDQYNQNRVTLSDSLIDFLAELEAGQDVEDLNLEDDTALADLQAYLAGLDDPATQDPLLAAWIASMTEALPGLRARPAADEPRFIEQAVIDALVAIENTTPHGLTGSAFAAIRDAAERLATTPDPDAPPAIVAHPVAAASAAGDALTLTVDVDGPGPFTYRWFKDGIEIPGATGPTFTLPSVQIFHTGDYSVTVSNANGSVSSNTAVVSAVAPPPNDARLLNLSTRGFAAAGANQLFPGFVISGTGTKKLLIRAVGPSLGDLGVPFATLPDPRMELKRYNFTTQAYEDLQTNDDWGTNANAAEITTTAAQLFAFPFTDPADAALLVDLPAGQYAVIGGDKDGTSAIGMVELYDADAGNPTATLINISNRGFVGTGDEVMIPGFVISHEGPKTLLIRVVGPTLALDPYLVPGTMVDPKLQLFRKEINGSDTLLLIQDNWGDNPAAANTATIAQQVSAFPLAAGSADAAFVVTLPPGVYTVIGSSADGTSTGVVLVEVYVVP